MSEHGKKTSKVVIICATLAAFAALAATVLVMRPTGTDEGDVTPRRLQSDSGTKPDRVPEEVASPDRAVERTEEGAIPDLMPEVFEVAERQVRDIRETTSAIMRTWDAELFETVANESIEETAANLGAEDDWTTTSFKMMSGSTEAGESSLVHRLVRVRRLMSAGSAEATRVVPLLREYMSQAVEKRRAALVEFWKAREETGVATLKSDRESDRMILACTYLLAELGDHDSLVPLMRSLSNPRWPPLAATSTPAFTLYAMHRLVQSYPQSRLSREAAMLRDEYLLAAKCLPEPEDEVLIAWTAHHPAARPGTATPGLAAVAFESRATTTLPVYPSTYDDGESISQGRTVSQRTQALLAKLEAFIRAAYPAEEF